MLSSEPERKLTRADFVASKALKLPHHPVPQCVIDLTEQRVKHRSCVASVVIYPSPKERIKLTSDGDHRQLRLVRRFSPPILSRAEFSAPALIARVNEQNN